MTILPVMPAQHAKPMPSHQPSMATMVNGNFGGGSRHWAGALLLRLRVPHRRRVRYLPSATAEQEEEGRARASGSVRRLKAAQEALRELRPRPLCH
jgi:hypothetical protein